MIWKIVIIMSLVMMFTGAMMYEENITPEQIDNVSEIMHYDNLNITLQEEGNNNNNSFVVRVLYKYMDFIGFTVVEGSRTAFRYGYKNPQYNFDFAWKIMFVVIFTILIKPLIYLLLFIGFGAYYLTQWIKKKRRHT